jgi:hypothetical protein
MASKMNGRSTVFDEVRAEAAADMLIPLLTGLFGEVPPKVRKSIRRFKTPEPLHGMVLQAIEARSLAEFITRAGI